LPPWLNGQAVDSCLQSLTIVYSGLEKQPSTTVNGSLMNSPFTSDGTERWAHSPEFQAKLQALHADIRARHSVALSSAGSFQRLLIRWRIACEFQRERKRLLPSVHTLYSTLAVPHR